MTIFLIKEDGTEEFVGNSATTPLTQNGLYVVVGNAEGYLEAKQEVTVNCDPANCLECNPTAYLTMVPTLDEGELVVVMGWPDQPDDLDIHAVVQNPSVPSYECHVYYGRQNCTYAVLDLDNSQGGTNGLETIYIRNMDDQVGFVYTIFVDDYLNMKAQFESSEAYIKVKDGIGSEEVYLRPLGQEVEKYWLVGCLKVLGTNAQGQTYQWKTINTFYPKGSSPRTVDPDLCLNQFSI